MDSLARDFRTEESDHPRYMSVETSLYSLIEAIQKRVGEDDDKVIEVLSRVLEKNRIRFPEETEAHDVRIS